MERTLRGVEQHNIDATRHGANLPDSDPGPAQL